MTTKKSYICPGPRQQGGKARASNYLQIDNGAWEEVPDGSYCPFCPPTRPQQRA